MKFRRDTAAAPRSSQNAIAPRSVRLSNNRTYLNVFVPRLYTYYCVTGSLRVRLNDVMVRVWKERWIIAFEKRLLSGATLAWDKVRFYRTHSQKTRALYKGFARGRFQNALNRYRVLNEYDESGFWSKRRVPVLLITRDLEKSSNHISLLENNNNDVRVRCNK